MNRMGDLDLDRLSKKQIKKLLKEVKRLENLLEPARGNMVFVQNNETTKMLIDAGVLNFPKIAKG